MKNPNIIYEQKDFEVKYNIVTETDWDKDKQRPYDIMNCGIFLTFLVIKH